MTETTKLGSAAQKIADGLTDAIEGRYQITEPPLVTEAEAWEKCPCPELCRAEPRMRPCLECWDAAGDIVAGLYLKDVKLIRDGKMRS